MLPTDPVPDEVAAAGPPGGPGAADPAPDPEEESAVRRHPRRSGTWAGVLAPAGGAPRDVVAVDLSAGGVFVADLADLPAGSRVVLRLPLGGGELAVAGVVRWVRHHAVTAGIPAGAGLAFVDLDDAARAALAAELGGVG